MNCSTLTSKSWEDLKGELKGSLPKRVGAINKRFSEDLKGELKDSCIITLIKLFLRLLEDLKGELKVTREEQCGQVP